MSEQQNPKSSLTPNDGKGKKNDSEKCMMQLITPRFIEGMGWVLTDGAKEYGVDNWRLFTPADKDRFIGAMMRHLNAYRDGQILDSKSGRSHLYHLACEAMFADEMDRRIEQEEIIEDARAVAVANEPFNLPEPGFSIPCGDTSCSICYRKDDHE